MERLWWGLVEAEWRGWGAAALALGGLVLAARGLWFGTGRHPGLLRQGRDAYAWIRGFQVAVAGLMLVVAAAAWAWRQPWLLAVALGILGEELFETSRILTALNREPRRAVARRRRSARAAASG